MLSPDQPLQSVAFAQVAATVDDSAITSAKLGTAAVTNAKLADSAITNIKLADSAVTSAKLATGAVTSDKLANGAVSGLDAPDGSPANAVDVNDQGFVTVGSDLSSRGLSPLPGAMVVKGASPDLQFLAPEGLMVSTDDVFGSLTAALDGATDVALVGTTAVVVADTDNTFSVINNADPDAPALLGMLTDGLGGVTTLGNPVAVAAASNFAYVVSASEDAFTIINISNPAAPAVSSTRTDGVGGFNDLNNPLDVAVSGNFAYVVSELDDAVTIINVTSKTAPTLAAVIKNGVGGITTLDSPRHVAVAGSRLYVSSAAGLSVFNITSPAAPALLGSINKFADGAIAVAGTTLYANNGSTLGAVDVSGTTPVVMSELRLEEYVPESGAVPTYGIRSLALNGSELWLVTGSGSSGLQPRVLRFDVSVAASPVLTHMSTTFSPFGTDSAKMHDPVAVVASASGQVAVAFGDPGGFASLTPVPGNTRKVSLTTTGDVGIGISQPQRKLHVLGDGWFERGSLQIGSGGQAAGIAGRSSLSVGNDNSNTSSNSALIGTNLRSTGASQLIVGTYNASSSSTLFAVGNGSVLTKNNALTVLSSGNIGLNGVHAPAHPIEHSSGARLTSGGTWTNASDRNLKENLRPADGRAVLEKLERLPLYDWNYRAEPGVTHTGPMAQDFRAAFGLGADETSISTVDADGVSLAALKALIEENRALRRRIEALEQRADAVGREAGR